MLKVVHALQLCAEEEITLEWGCIGGRQHNGMDYKPPVLKLKKATLNSAAEMLSDICCFSTAGVLCHHGF